MKRIAILSTYFSSFQTFCNERYLWQTTNQSIYKDSFGNSYIRVMGLHDTYGITFDSYEEAHDAYLLKDYWEIVDLLKSLKRLRTPQGGQ
jgi:hypothetical protein